MGKQSYNTGLVQTARDPIVCTTKVTVNLATGAVTLLNGKRLTTTAGVGTGVITIALPQTVSACEYADVIVLDPTLTGTYSIPTQAETTVNNRTTMQFTLVKGGSPAAVTSGTFTLYAIFYAVTA